VALAQIGEFSLILATVGDQLNILPANATNLIVATAILTITLNPMLYRSIGRLDTSLARWGRTRRHAEPEQADPQKDDERSGYRAVVVGYGPIGQTVSRLLKEGGITPVIIETNIETTRRIRHEGYTTVYGNAEHVDVLEAAGISNAVALVLSGPNNDQTAEIIRVARRMNANLNVLARTNYLRDSVAMRTAGANEVFSGEGEVALAMTEHILSLLGATPEQMDRERERVRDEVFRDTSQAG
jgi:CPA2 family monovalent cation:H+ antiporter-2